MKVIILGVIAQFLVATECLISFSDGAQPFSGMGVLSNLLGNSCRMGTCGG